METNGVIVTNAGLKIINEAITKEIPIEFTTMKIGTGNLSNIVDAKKLTNLVVVFKDIGLTSIIKTSYGYTKFRGAFTNETFKTTTVIKELGLYAKVGDLPETLFAYVNDGEGEVFPSASTGNIVEKTRDLVIGITDTIEAITILDKSVIYATIYDLEEHIEQHLHEEFKILIGSRYKGNYDFRNYLPGDTYFKNSVLSIAVQIDESKNTSTLDSELTKEKIRKLVQLSGEEEVNFYANLHHASCVVGIELDSDTKVESANYTVGFSVQKDIRIIGIEVQNNEDVGLGTFYNEEINTSPALHEIKSEYIPVHKLTNNKATSFTY